MANNRVDGYEDFYKRSFQDVDIREIFKQGGGTDFRDFKDASRNNIASLDHWEVMFEKKKGRKDELGKEIFKRFFDVSGLIRKNVRDRTIVQKGKILTHKGKTYKGGQFLPKDFIIE